jgi:ABC-type transport system involved in multi-copper enzyme maturation permease subunit
LGLLGLAAMRLRHSWRTEIVDHAKPGWHGKWARWLHGSAAWRESLRRKTLSQNPFQWLAQQDRRPVVLAYSFIAATTALWISCCLFWPQAWPSPMNLYLTAFFLIAGVHGVMLYAAALRMGIERSEGSLELLLTTPLQPGEIVAGQLAALKAQFKPVRLTLVGLFCLMMAGGFLTRTWTATAVVSYSIVWAFFFGWALSHQGHSSIMSMWIALNTGRPVSAVFTTLRGQKNKRSWVDYYYYYYFFFVIPNMLSGLIHARNFPSGSAAEVVVISFIAVVALLITAATQNSSSPVLDRLKMDMRSIAQSPIPDLKDPRFKKWITTQRLVIADDTETIPQRAKPSAIVVLGGKIGKSAGRSWNELTKRRR